MERLSGAGMEMLDQSDAMPLLKLIATNSPELIPDDDKYIEGCKAGDIVFNKTGEILPKPVEFLVVAKTTIYAEWRPKKDGGGLVGHHPLTAVAHKDYRKGNDKSAYKEFLGKNDLNLTMYYMVKFLLNDEWVEGILSFSSTGLSAAGRPLNKLIAKFQYPEGSEVMPFLFSQTYLLDSFLDKDDENQWYNWKVAPGRVLDFKEDVALLEDCLDTQEAAIKELPSPDQPQGQLAIEGAQDAEVLDDDEEVPF